MHAKLFAGCRDARPLCRSFSLRQRYSGHNRNGEGLCLARGAQIATSIGLTCSTSPCLLEVSRKKEFTVTVTKEGYEEQTVHVGTVVAPGGVAGMAGNVLVGGVVGMGVDAVSGATLDHIPNPVLVELVPIDPKDPKTPKGDLSSVRERIAEKRREQEEAAMRKTGGV